MEIKGFRDLEGKTVAKVKGYAFAKALLKPYEEKIDLIETQSTLEGMKLVFEGKADAVVGLNFDNYLIARHTLTGISVVFIDLNNAFKKRYSDPE